MDVHKAVITRRTVRRFLSKPVSHNIVCNILGTACYAPSSGNLQNWRIIVVRDAQKRHDIASVCLEQMWMATAPVQIVVCNNTVDIERFYGKRGKEVYSIENCAAFIQNVLLLATENNLGSACGGRGSKERGASRFCGRGKRVGSRIRQKNRRENRRSFNLPAG